MAVRYVYEAEMRCYPAEHNIGMCSTCHERDTCEYIELAIWEMYSGET